MTYLEMSNLLDALCDKAGSPYFTDSEKQSLLNIAVNDYVEMEYGKFEMDGAHKLNLLPIERPFTKANSSFLIIGTDLPNFRYLTRFRSKYNKVDCNGATIVKYAPIKPARKDSIDVATSQDPFNKPTDEYPMYTYNNTGSQQRITVHSTTTPLELDGEYIIDPIVIDLVNAPNTVFQFDDKTAMEICEMASKKMLNRVENYNMAQSLIPEIKQLNETFQ
jgi:hypothetical protein